MAGHGIRAGGGGGGGSASACCSVTASSLFILKVNAAVNESQSSDTSPLLQRRENLLPERVMFSSGTPTFQSYSGNHTTGLSVIHPCPKKL